VAQPLAQADPPQHLGGQRRASLRPCSSSGSITFSSAVRVPRSWKLWNTKPTCDARTAGPCVLVQREEVGAAQPHGAVVGVSRPAMMDSSVLLPDPDAPTMAAECRGSRVKSISWRIVSVPVESCTCLVTRSTAMMG
jgi:hypothetical protein